MLQKVLVWDVPTRIFHWSLAASFAGAYLTAESERYRDIHVALGYVMLGLILFRLVWGFTGTAYARFGSFLYSPAQVVAYVRSLFSPQPQHHVGHNPAGGVAIFLLLTLGLLISVSGLGLYWEIGDEDMFEELHEIAANLMLAVVFIHIAGVVVSSVLHKENLPRSMLTGYKFAREDAAIASGHVWLGAGMFAAIAGFLIVYLGYI
jgi:cytochrome b